MKKWMIAVMGLLLLGGIYISISSDVLVEKSIQPPGFDQTDLKKGVHQIDQAEQEKAKQYWTPERKKNAEENMPVIKGELKKPDQQSLVPKGKPRLVLPIAPDGKTLPVPENIHKLIHQEQSDVNP